MPRVCLISVDLVRWGTVGHPRKRPPSGGDAGGREEAAMARTIPDEIVACLEELASALADWCVEGRDHPLATHEAAVLARVRGVAAAARGGGGGGHERAA